VLSAEIFVHFDRLSNLTPIGVAMKRYFQTDANNFFRSFILTIVVLLTTIFSLTSAGEIDTLFILQTTDVHGNIYPYNYFTDKEAPYGLARAYTKVSEYRQKHANVILIDSGDLLQGTPLIYYFNKIESSVFNPLILTLNYMGYDAFTVGNHDIEQGFPVYYRAWRSSDFAWLSANGLRPDGRTLFEPYVILETNGIKVGVLGLTTPAIPMWLDSTLYPGIYWDDMVESAKYWAPDLRSRVDVLAGSFHAGFNENYSKKQTDRLGLPNENASGLVAKKIPLFDVVFAGHSHRPVGRIGKSSTVEKSNILVRGKETTLLLNAGSRAQNIAVARFILEKSPDGSFEILSKDGWLEPLKNTPPSQAILTLTRKYHEKTLKYTHTVIATLTDTLNGRMARWEDTPLMDLINGAQLELSKADISFAACFNDRLLIPPGNLTIKNVYQMYKYENYLYVVEMTGQQIKDFLEYSSQYFQWKDGAISVNPKMAGYNFDMAEGIGYRIHVKNPLGSRITDLTDLKSGKPLDMERVYRVAMNSYRATGGGGHLAAANASDAPIIWKSQTEIRNLLIDYIKNKKIINPKTNHNWKLLP